MRGATLAALLGATPLEEPGLAALVVSDANKARLAAEAVEQLLLGCRRAALAPLRRGLAAVLGEAALSALRPEELCRRLLGWEQPQEGPHPNPDLNTNPHPNPNLNPSPLTPTVNRNP